MNLQKEHSNLIRDIENRKVVLFLGSGASYSCQHREDPSKSPPMGNALRDKICDHFLNGTLKDQSLATVAELAISDSSLFDVQSFIKEIFSNYLPCQGHKIMTSLAWAGVVSTNYDTLVEAAYTEGHSTQNLKSVVTDQDSMIELLKSPESVAYLKLHGCVTKIETTDPPLILSNDQYANYEEGRQSLFDTLKEWAAKYCFVFIGYAGQDQNIRKFITHLVTNQEHRPRYYLVKPSFETYETKFWTSKRITPIPMTFDKFMESVDTCFSGVFRGLDVSSMPPSGIERQFIAHDIKLSKIASLFVSKDCIYVADLNEGNAIDPTDFYRGVSEGWQWLRQNVDITRPVIDDLIEYNILLEDPSQPTELNLVLIAGYAGSGKSVALKRVAWEAAHSYDQVVFYLNENGELNSSAIQEIIDSTNKRLFLFIDDANHRAREISRLIKNLGSDANMLTIVMAARSNEWSTQTQKININVNSTYELGALNHHEIVNLVEKLETTNSLCYMTRFNSSEDRVKHFKKRAQGNLLVALHEATHGKPIENIIEDEYHSIETDQARSLYLTICVMNRLGIGVRAGMIARLDGVDFDRFQADFFIPLEKVVYCREDTLLRDMVYTARHPLIAQIVFERVLVDHQERFDYYSRVLRNLNLSYSSDEKAFDQMIKGRALRELFTDNDYVEEIYNQACDKVGATPHLLHQRGIFEMQRSGGSLQLATTYLDEALSKRPNNSSINHSLSELALKKAEKARTSLERDKYLREAQSLAKHVTKKRKTSHAQHTLAKIAIARVTSLLTNDSELQSATTQSFIKEAEIAIREGLITYPNDSYLLDASAQLANILNDSPRAIQHLSTAFNANKKLSYIARQLFDCHVRDENYEEAEKVILEALDAKTSDKHLCYLYGSYLMDRNLDSEKSTYYLQRSFVPNDKSYDAQIRYGCELFRNKNYQSCRDFFSSNHNRQFVAGFAGKIFYRLPQEREASIKKIERNYLTLVDRESKLTVHCQKRDSPLLNLETVAIGDTVSFSLGFNILGLIGANLKN